MTRTLSVLASVIVGLTTVAVAGCGTTPNPRPSPSSRPAHSPSPKPTSSPTTPATTALVLAVGSVPTSYGVPGASPAYPASIRVLVPTALAAQIAAYGVAGTVVVGPAGWSGSGQVGADGSASFSLLSPGSAAGSVPELVYQFDGACGGCAWGDASAFFPSVAEAAPGAGVGPASSPPAGLVTEPLANGLIGFSLPTLNPADQLNGVAYTNLPAGSTDPIFESLELTLPTTEHVLATVILNALVANEDRYVCASGAAAPTISLALSNGTC
ncbi:MAG: DUF4850 domain-containing protein [Candidatus Dormibacteria bacterium]